MSRENLIKDRSVFHKGDDFINYFHDLSLDYYVLTMLRENLCWSHLGFRDISKNQEGQSVLVQ